MHSCGPCLAAAGCAGPHQRHCVGPVWPGSWGASGNGVCGLGRRSVRPLEATPTFMEPELRRFARLTLRAIVLQKRSCRTQLTFT
jgi:hypothetical protein